VALAAFGVAAGVADENKAVPGDRRGRDELAPACVGDRRRPNALAGLEVIGEHSSIQGAAVEHAIQVGCPTHRRQDRGRHIFTGTPILGAACRIEGENVGHGRADQSAVDHDQA
jgi:hypothetical protein